MARLIETWAFYKNALRAVKLEWVTRTWEDLLEAAKSNDTKTFWHIVSHGGNNIAIEYYRSAPRRREIKPWRVLEE